MWGGARGSVPVAPRARLPQRSGTAHGLKPPARVAARVRGSQIALGGPRGAGEREREGGLNARLRWPEQAGGPPSVQGGLWDSRGRPAGGRFPGKVAGSLSAPALWPGPARKPARPPALPHVPPLWHRIHPVPSWGQRGGQPQAGPGARAQDGGAVRPGPGTAGSSRDGKRGSGRARPGGTRAQGASRPAQSSKGSFQAWPPSPGARGQGAHPLAPGCPWSPRCL